MNPSLKNEPGSIPTTTGMGAASNVKSEDVFRKGDAIDVAPNWKLVWWRFKKHRLALVSGVIFIVIALIAVFPDFFSTRNPHKTSATKSFMPVQGIHFFENGNFNPHIEKLVGKRNSKTLKMEWKAHETQKIPIEFFVEGYYYQILGMIETNIHFLGVSDPK